MMLPNIISLPLVALLVYSNESQPWIAEEEGARPPRPLQPPGRWSTSTWGPCGNPCGRGEELRQVSCVLEDVTGTLIVATDGFCAPPHPASARQCYQYQDECENAWVAGDWGQCSARCGGGQRSRVVECRGQSDAGSSPGASSGVALRPAQCVAQLRPAERRDCNLQPCPDGRRVWLRTSDGRRPRRIKLFSKFSLRCPFAVYWTPADDRSKRKYAWYKDGQRLPLHDDKYTMTDNRGELRVKGADEPDSGLYTCASQTGNPQGKTHNITVTLERIPGEPSTPAPPTEDSAEASPSAELEDAMETVTTNYTSADGTSTPMTTEAQTEASKTETTEVTSPIHPSTPVMEAEVEASTTPTRRRREVGSVVTAARYDAAPFSNCSAACGGAGLRQRAVRCVDNETGAQLPLSDCEDLGPPPPPQEACNRVDCPPLWLWPPWSKCSRPCGGGSKRRRGQCSQTLADGAEVGLGPERCEAAGLGPAEQRRDCHRAPCRARVREGEVLRLQCLSANVTWHANGAPLDVEGGKHHADDDSGTLYVFEVTEQDAGEYDCVEDIGDGVTVTHRFEVAVLAPVVPAINPIDEFFVRVCNDTRIPPDGATGTGTATGTATIPDAKANAEMKPEDEFVTREQTDNPTTVPPHATEPTIPWHLLLTPAAEGKGRVLGIFT